MNLEELISKYLDGEMLEQEDELLRKKLSEDAAARMKFDSAINIHIACKEDAESILTPDDLVEKTEDMILMRIFAQAPEPQKKRALVWFNTPMLAAMIALFMFIFVAEISNFKQFNEFNKLNELGVNGVDRVGNVVIEPNVGRIPKVSEENEISNVNVIAGGTVLRINNDDENFAEAGFMDNKVDVNAISNNDLSANASGNVHVAMVQPQLAILIKPDVVDTEMEVNEPAKIMIVSSDINLLSPALESNNDFSVALPVKPAGMAAGNFGEMVVNDFSGSSDVQVASFFGTDVLRVGIDANKAIVSHFSQSVAYSVSESGRLGVELGYTEYAYNDEALINLKTKIGGSSTGVESYEGGYDFSYTYPYHIKMKNNKQMLWTSAFYENTLYKTSGLALVGRVGAGGSSDGPLGYGRVFAQYTVFNGFNLTLGAEGRMFSAEIPKFVKSNDKIKTTATIIYGFQFQF